MYFFAVYLILQFGGYLAVINIQMVTSIEVIIIFAKVNIVNIGGD